DLLQFTETDTVNPPFVSLSPTYSGRGSNRATGILPTGAPGPKVISLDHHASTRRHDDTQEALAAVGLAAARVGLGLLAPAWPRAAGGERPCPAPDTA